MTPFTVLIVDDTPANLSVLLQCLSDAGHQVLVAEDGEEALELVSRRPPDLVLLDVMMPGIDGFETCRRLKAQPSTADIPVIFMTALTDTREKLQGFAAGAVDYVTKPIQHEEALARVSTHLKIRRLQQELATELAVKRRFMRIASHDLRNPLCLTSFALAVARRKVTDPQRVRAQLDEIDASLAQMRSIIDTFLDLTPPGADQSVDLVTLTAAVVHQHQVMAEAKDQTLGLAPTETVFPTVRGSSTLLFPVIANLISNALKFTPAHGTATVALSRRVDAVRLSVTDTGPGVPENERELLFTDNARLSPRPTGGEASHGYGLSIVRQLVEQLGGCVGAEFPAAGGSVFWCEFPIA